MNSIVFTSNAVQFEEINLNNQDYVGIGENLTIIRYEDIQLPDKVYKYRGWSKEEHKKTLTHSELYFAPPSSFGDHHECNLPLRYDLVTPEFKRKWLINSSKEINPKFSRKKHKEFVNKWIKNSPFNDPEHRKRVEQDFRLKLDNELGILSLTPIGNNPDMWDYFGEDHTGISIGFNSRNLFASNETFASGGPIEYYEPNNPPIIMPFHLNSKERVKAGFTNVFSLPKQWEHEQEFRVAKLHIRNRVINFNSESIVEVILGSRMNIQDKEEVLSIIRIQYPNIDVFESVINVNGELILNKIEL